MTAELLALLRRVEAAGGPVEVDASGEVVFVRLSPRCEVTLDLEAGSREQPRNGALLIHALRLDARERGILVQEARDFTFMGGGFLACVQGLVGDPHCGRHADEACAWLLAWLDAFEDTE